MKINGAKRKTLSTNVSDIAINGVNMETHKFTHLDSSVPDSSRRIGVSLVHLRHIKSISMVQEKDQNPLQSATLQSPSTTNSHLRIRDVDLGGRRLWKACF